ncbi:hypothetical protein [Mesorhizobium sp. B2-7-2]|uniref:hypothetical protein n=1 Tax=Mesorhizobium sp. B2-7-2 TaxID=2589908 RepID=UPI001128CA73|nr:hypothetical protein [Mesorhizobium sp. B2-7-2]TPJ20856.1 hypothetical protein FJ425_26425 [Mesorhizobium sp. B2-7-2]
MPFADVAELHNAIIDRDPSDFVSHYIFEPIPFAFSSDFDKWVSWKTTLAKGLEVDPYDIVLTGSGAIGFSLNPYKGFSAFDDRSDIDCGVISAYHFDLAWRHLRQLRPSWLSLSNAAKRAIESHRKSYVFTGTIATDSILSILPFGKVWQTALTNMAGIDPTVGRDVKLRIYKDYDALRQYQAMNISRLRSTLLSSVEDQTPIDIEI